MRQCLDAAPGRVLAAAGLQAPGEEHGAPSWSGFIKGMSPQRAVRLTTALGRQAALSPHDRRGGARPSVPVRARARQRRRSNRSRRSPGHGHGGRDRHAGRRQAPFPRAGEPGRVRRLRERRGALPGERCGRGCGFSPAPPTAASSRTRPLRTSSTPSSTRYTDSSVHVEDRLSGQLRQPDLLRPVSRERPRLRRPAAAGRGCITYFFVHDADKHTLVLADAPEAYQTCAATTRRCPTIPCRRRRGASATTSTGGTRRPRCGPAASPTPASISSSSRTDLLTRRDLPLTQAAWAEGEVYDYSGNYTVRDAGRADGRPAAGGRPGRASAGGRRRHRGRASPPATASRSPATRATTRTSSIWCARWSTRWWTPPTAAARPAARRSRSTAAGSPRCRPTCPTGRR